MGTPATWFFVALDTGSDLFWLPCNCGTTCIRDVKDVGLPQVPFSSRKHILFFFFFFFNSYVLFRFSSFDTRVDHSIYTAPTHLLRAQALDAVTSVVLDREDVLLLQVFALIRSSTFLTTHSPEGPWSRMCCIWSQRMMV